MKRIFFRSFIKSLILFAYLLSKILSETHTSGRLIRESLSPPSQTKMPEQMTEQELRKLVLQLLKSNDRPAILKLSQKDLPIEKLLIPFFYFPDKEIAGTAAQAHGDIYYDKLKGDFEKRVFDFKRIPDLRVKVELLIGIDDRQKKLSTGFTSEIRRVREWLEGIAGLLHEIEIPNFYWGLSLGLTWELKGPLNLAMRTRLKDPFQKLIHALMYVNNPIGRNGWGLQFLYTDRMYDYTPYVTVEDGVEKVRLTFTIKEAAIGEGVDVDYLLLWAPSFLKNFADHLNLEKDPEKQSALVMDLLGRIEKIYRDHQLYLSWNWAPKDKFNWLEALIKEKEKLKRIRESKVLFDNYEKTRKVVREEIQNLGGDVSEYAQLEQAI